MVSLGELSGKMSKLNNWALEGSSISKIFSFPGFKDASEFVLEVAKISEEENHYPRVVISKDIVKLTLTTPEERGVGDKDFSLAEKIDNIGKETPKEEVIDEEKRSEEESVEN